MQVGDFAAVAHGHPVALEIFDQVLRHRLAQVRAAVQKGHERAAASQPNGCLCCGVATPDHPHALAGAELTLERPGGVEDADALVAVKTVHRQAAIFSACGKQDGAGAHFDALLEPDDVPPGAGFEYPGAVWRGDPGVELARL